MSSITATFTTSGALARLDADALSLLQYPATELEAGPANLWLRVREAATIRPHPLTGPASGATVGQDAVTGRLGDLVWTAWFDRADDAYCWQWEVHNGGDVPVAVDVVLTQDVALAPLPDVRRNEYYVAQYLDLTPVETSHGTALGVRQNMPDSGHPWLGLVSLTGVAGWVTDAAQLTRVGGGLDLGQDLPGTRWQHEHTLAGLQAPAVSLAPGQTATGGFVGAFVAEHPDATGAADAAVLDAALARHWRGRPEVEGPSAVPTLFDPRAMLGVRAATDAGLPSGVTQVERGPDDGPWSAFDGVRHLVTRDKERAVLRPHGHVLHHAPGPVADEGSVASTSWMNGVFCSQLTRGHASAAPVVSLRRSYAGLSLAGGVRVAVRVAGTWRLLGIPTLWAQDPRSCSWRYAADGLDLTVTAEVTGEGVRLGVACEPAADLLVAIGTDADGLTISGEEVGDDGPLFADGVARGTPWRTVVAPAASELGLVLGVPDGRAAEAHDWAVPRLRGDAPGVGEVDALLPWLAQNAAVHFQAPRGLEQFTGGAWGTRDVCQGPVGLLLAAGEHAALRATLLAVFAGQQEDGDWPQWFDYLASSAAPGYRDSHGDIVYWPLLALGEYLLVTGDVAVLDESVRFVGRAEFTASEPVREHVQRAVGRLESRRTADPRLPAYGHGDWNDSLQPARPELADRMCSAWTSVLEIEALRTLASGLGGADAAFAARLDALAARTETAVREVLLVDDELAGYGLVEPGGVELFVHPRDETTGLRHGSLQVIHAIASELFTPEEARAHVALADEHLVGPHGIYLFDAPVAYSGGEMHVFRRAEAASFWGREIGLMYTHAHLRWIEALTHLGEADRAWAGLLAVVPIAVRDRISGARPRQASCYYSSADALFPDRYAARERARELFDPATPFEGGWRVYSSGPGLLLRLVAERLLGLRFRAAGLEVDPVLPHALDGLVASVPVPGGGEAEVTYSVGAAGHGVRRVLVDGREVTGTPLAARYRTPGVRLDPGAIRAGSRVEVEVG